MDFGGFILIKEKKCFLNTMSQRITEYHSLKYSSIKRVIDEQNNLYDAWNSIGLECTEKIRTHMHPPRGEFETTEMDGKKRGNR